VTLEDLSVVIPAFNAEESISRAVTSAIHLSNEVIVVDDGSSDRTAEVGLALGAQVIRQENAGAYAARRKGAEYVTSPFVIFLDADDQLIEDGVRHSLQRLRADPRTGVVAGSVIGVDHRGRVAQLPRGYSDVDTASLVVHGYSPWPPAAQVIRTAAYFEQVSMKLPALAPRYAEDYELLLRLSLITEISCHSEPSCVYKVDGGKSALNAIRVVECKERIRNFYGAYSAVSWEPMTRRQQQGAAYARATHAAIMQGDVTQACIRAAHTALVNPSLFIKAIQRRLSAK
jgi:hypothetical protein